MSALDEQVGGDHYRKLGEYQPWVVFPHWFTPDEIRGHAKMVAIEYLQRERDKGGIEDIRKAKHVLELYLESLPTGIGGYVICDDEEADRIIKDVHEKQQKKTMQCPVCFYSFEDEAEFDRHMALEGFIKDQKPRAEGKKTWGDIYPDLPEGR